MQPSATLAMTAAADARKRAGHPVIGLSAGEPDFATPEVIAEAGIRAIREGHTYYTPNAGYPELREAIAAKLQRENGLSYRPEQILCSNGAKQSVAQSVLALVRDGDEVLIPAPFWVSYPEMVRLAGGGPVIVPTTVASDYLLAPEQLEAAITERTRVLILCSPSNPTGGVYTPEMLEGLVEVLRRHPGIFVISDEIYEHIVYDVPHRSIATWEGMKERTVTINGFSKAYAMTGWRLGYLAAELPIVKAAATLQSQLTSAPSTITQVAGIAALNMDIAIVQEMVRAFRKRRDLMLERLAAIPGVVCPRPEGAFYLFPDIGEWLGSRTPTGEVIRDTQDLCMYILNQHDVALVPGQAFGGPTGIRLSYAASETDLMTACDRLDAAFGLLKRP
ncbi:MAG: pyridoxal phosphate-dependent aminotransferase [Bacteroidetes bacterium]|nr:pyridoxal phosphate-dependent aminotransferase [Bacteroidota bacterium]MDA0874220.1 pyridoxal phosphate-dependent aminotransferase [Bacteroidota bacterium]